MKEKRFLVFILKLNKTKNEDKRKEVDIDKVSESVQLLRQNVEFLHSILNSFEIAQLGLAFLHLFFADRLPHDAVQLIHCLLFFGSEFCQREVLATTTIVGFAEVKETVPQIVLL